MRGLILLGGETCRPANTYLQPANFLVEKNLYNDDNNNGDKKHIWMI